MTEIEAIKTLGMLYHIPLTTKMPDIRTTKPKSVIATCLSSNKVLHFPSISRCSLSLGINVGQISKIANRRTAYTQCRSRKNKMWYTFSLGR